MKKKILLPKALPKNFYNRNAVEVAKDLLGCEIIYKKNKINFSSTIVETESYRGSKDPASHAFRGLTKRNSAMFGPPGHWYIYFTYGMHYCANLVCEEEGIGAAVLIRAVEPTLGISAFQKRRNLENIFKLTNGPAKFTQAFQLTKKQNGFDATKLPLIVCKNRKIKKSQIGSSVRIGINNLSNKKWRFFIKGSKFLSR